MYGIRKYKYNVHEMYTRPLAKKKKRFGVHVEVEKKLFSIVIISTYC